MRWRAGVGKELRFDFDGEEDEGKERDLKLHQDVVEKVTGFIRVSGLPETWRSETWKLWFLEVSVNIQPSSRSFLQS